MKQVNGLYLPDRENYLIQDIEASPMFAGAGTVQFKKFAKAFPEIRGWRHAIDIGSNLGIWTRVMARCFAQISCFEPNPECHEAFFKNQESNNICLVQLYPVALGNSNDPVWINTQLKSTAFTRVDNNGNFAVKQRTLDSFGFEEVDFIKIDVEGWEHNVIKGGIETITKWKPVVIIEQKPNNAEMHGLKQFGARNLLQKLGMKVATEISGDIIMVW